MSTGGSLRPSRTAEAIRLLTGAVESLATQAERAEAIAAGTGAELRRSMAHTLSRVEDLRVQLAAVASVTVDIQRTLSQIEALVREAVVNERKTTQDLRRVREDIEQLRATYPAPAGE